MAYGMIGLYALYLIFVGANANAKPLYQEVEKDIGGFAPWLISIIVLKALYEVDVLKPTVKPFVGLALLTFTLRNYDTVAGEVEKITGLNLRS